MQPSFQIIIVLYNNEGTIGPTLDAVQNLRYPNFQTYVVDNASGDGGAEFVAQSYPKAKLIRSAFNRGFAGANNDESPPATRLDLGFALNF